MGSAAPNPAEMQQRLGNNGTQAWLAEQGGGQPVQAKLTVGEPNDKYEQEADRVADTVMRMPEPAMPDDEETKVQAKPIANQITPLVRRMPEEADEEETVVQQMSESESEADEESIVAQQMSYMTPEESDNEEEEIAQAKSETAYSPDIQRQMGEDEEEEIVQAKRLVQRQSDEEQEELLQGKFAANVASTQLQGGSDKAENRTGMSDTLKTGLEQLSGMDLSGVRVHKNSSKPAQINALAYAQGQDIHVGPGQEKHLPHEGWHAVQQIQGRVKPTVQAKGVSINDDDELEKEADVMGAKALQMTHAERAPTGSIQQIQMKANDARDGQAVDPSNDWGVQVSSLGASTTHTVQRNGDEESNLDRLNEMLDSFDVPEEDVITLCGNLTASEKTTVLAGGYRRRMANALNISEMVRAVNNLEPVLSTKLEWVNEAAFTTNSIDYDEIDGMVRSAPQVERDALKTATWMSFFVDVCTNETMVTALNDLGFDLETKLNWLNAEMTKTSWELDYSTIKPWITAAPQAERDVLKTGSWKSFFVDVCSNETMGEALNDLGFDLETKLNWLHAEMTITSWELDYATIKPWITAAPQGERDALKTDAWKSFFVDVCTNETMEEALIDLNYDMETQVRWMIAESDEKTVLDAATFMTKVRAASNYNDLMKILGVDDAFIYDLRIKVRAGDKTGFFADVSGLAGGRAGDAAVRSAFTDFVTNGHITWTDAFHAAVLLELGPRRGWPQLIKNYYDGLVAGTFTITALPPTGAEPLRQFCMVQAGEAAEGTGVSASYRNQFNSLWDAPPHAALSADFDPTLDSKGPRNQRARSIFNALYADVAIKTAYDTNAPAGFRDMCDTLMGPEGTNLIASPQLQRLRGLLTPPVVTATGTADPLYVALVGTVRPVAEALDSADRQQLRQSHSWRLVVDAKVSGSTSAITQTLRDDLWTIIRTSRPAVAPAPVVPVVPAPPEAPPALNPTKRAWLGSITLTAPPSPVLAQTAQQDLTFQINSGVPNPAVPARRHIVVEPAVHVISGQDDQTPWPVGSKAVPHTATVDPDAGAAPSRVFTARLNMPPVRSADFAEQTANVTVEDKRQDWFKNNIAIGATFMDENVSTSLSGGSTIHYYGEQLSLTVRPKLPADNPGLGIEMEGEVKKGGAVVHTFGRKPFGPTSRSDQLGSYIEQEGGAPPASEPMEINVSFFRSAGPAIKTLNLVFNVAPSLPVVAGTDAAILTADNAALNQSPATAGSLLNFMTTIFPPTSAHHRVANAVASGAIQVEAVIVRSDSATWLAAHGGNPNTQVAYALGNMTDPRVLKANPGAQGWRTPRFPNHVFLNLTPQINSPATKRPNAEMAGLLAHEGIHAADKIEPGALGQYSTEFRAYWIMGTGAGLSTAPDSTMSGKGPKSPRAREIFEHLYNHPLYSSFTRPNYDQNINHFRERVDNMLVPDGINLTLSGKLKALRTEIESYTGPATFAAKRAAIGVLYAACTASDKLEITNNRAWRNLVESKFTNSANRAHIKTDLAIPQ